ncbi:MAG: GntR family transcriptional regulator [Planctomycetota bacterium]|nr:MAG: GntR family transcriptional regulator [Planctomycetota bacterium]
MAETEPIRKRLRRYICRNIIEGHWPPGHMLPSREQMANTLHVSLRSLQMVMDELMADGTLVTIASKGTFVTAHPHCLHRLAMVLPPDNHPGLCTSLRTVGKDPKGPYSFAYRALNDLDQVIEDLDYYRYRGIILLDEPLAYSQDMQQRLRQFPLVVIGYMSDAFARVHLDLYASISWGLRQLAAEGFERIAIISQSRKTNQLQTRIQRWLSMLKLPYDPRWLLEININSPHTAGNLVPLLWSLPQAERPQAILISDDHLVPSVTKAFRRCTGQDVPHVLAHANHPRMSRSAVPAQRYGFRAEDILANAIELLEDWDNNPATLRTMRPQMFP